MQRAARLRSADSGPCGSGCPLATVVLEQCVQGSLAESRIEAMLAQAAAAPPGPRAEALRSDLLHLLPRASDAHRLAIAGWCLRRHDWQGAATAFESLAAPAPAEEMRARWARNLAAVQAFRPDLYEVLFSSPAAEADRYQPLAARNGQMTLVYRSQTGRLAPLGSLEDPQAFAEQMLEQLKITPQCSAPVTLGGIGDGRLLELLALQPPPLLLGMTLPVYLIEPDPAALQSAFLLRDFSGPDGPIQQARFHWFVGRGWERQLKRAMMEEAFLPSISLYVGQTPHGPAISRGIEAAAGARAERAKRLAERTRTYYAGLDQAHWLDRFSETPSEPPRVLIITSRFTTVLQYSSRDCADAFQQIGWQARLLIEPQPHHRLTCAIPMHEAVAQWRPDLVLILDHLRCEYPQIFPPQLPFACWIQDHLPNLLSSAAGASVGLRDYVLTSVAPLYTGLYGYPQRQCLGISKLSRIPQRPEHWESEGEDLVYVSNASATPQQVLDELLQQNRESPAALKVLARCGEKLEEHYANGKCIATLAAMGELLDQVLAEVGLAIPSDMVRSGMIQTLFHPLNNAFYRQQALQWAAAAARQRGLRLGLYGAGWETHPTLGVHARGPVAYGPALEELTRRTRINLQIVPYFCLHQRLLDGLVAGGFFLVREHPSDRLLHDFSRFLLRHFSPEVQSVKDAQAAVAGNPPLRAQLEAQLTASCSMADLGVPIDLVQWVRGNQAAQLLIDQDEAVPHLAEVSFSDAPSLGERIDRFLADDLQRRRVAAEQRRNIESRLSYIAGMRRTIQDIHRLLREEKAG